MPAFASTLPENFDRFVTQEIEPLFASLQQARADSRAKFKKFGLIGLIAGAIAGSTFFAFKPELWFVGVGLALAGIMFGLIPGAILLGKAKANFREQHVSKVAAFLGLSHQARGFSPARFDDFTELKLIPSGDRRSFSNLITGSHQDQEFTIYGALIEEKRSKTVTDSKGNTRTETYWATVFDGQLLHLVYPRKFACTTIIARDQGWFNFKGRFGKTMKPMGLADPKFEKLFEVYTTDQVEGRFLVDPDFMVRLLDLEANHKKRRATAAFFDQSVFVVLHGGKGYFGKLDKNSNARSLAVESVTAFQRIFGFLDALKGKKRS